MWLSIDGIEWDMPCDITQSTEIRVSDISGWMMDGSRFDDFEGTYHNYSIKIVPRPDQMGRYYSLYELLTAPQAHTFILPYDGETVTFTGRVEAPQRVLRRFGDGHQIWIGNVFNITASSPTKQVTLGESITRGRPALPDIAEPEEGQTYVYTADGWQQTGEAYPDGDTIYW